MPESSQSPIWQRHWFQFLLGVLLVLAVAGIVLPPLFKVLYAARSVLVPLLIALALAYAVNPLVNWMQARLKVPRAMSALLIMLSVAVVVISLFIYLAPTLYYQSQDLVNKAQRYGQELTERLDMTEVRQSLHEAVNKTLGGSTSKNTDSQDTQTAQTPPKPAPTPAPGSSPETGQPAPSDAAAKAAPDETDTTAAEAVDAASETLDNIDFGAVYKAVMGTLDVGYGVVSTAIGFTTYLLLATVIIFFCFFFFVWKFSAVTGFFVPFIPIQYRARTLELAGMMDRTVSGFIRGRIVQVTVIAVVLSGGWWLAGVPYWLLLGILGGVLNLIPYAAVIAWPLAVLLAWLHGLSTEEAFSFWGVVFWPSLVYFVAQTLDGWVVEPLVQGKATDLDPLTVLLCVLIGGSLLGLLGMLIAIPTTACIKILLREVVLPRLRQLAADRSVLE